MVFGDRAIDAEVFFARTEIDFKEIAGVTGHRDPIGAGARRRDGLIPIAPARAPPDTAMVR